MRCNGKTKNGERCKNICGEKLCHIHRDISFKFGDISDNEAKFAVILAVLAVVRGPNMNGEQAFVKLSEQLDNPNLSNEILRKFPNFRAVLNMNLINLITTFHRGYEEIGHPIGATRIRTSRFYKIGNNIKDSFDVVKEYF
jgi:hypothetical protein